MMQSKIETYTDLFYTVKEEYAKELDSIDSESEFIEFSNFKELRRSVEEC
ncbi:MAG TPA: hypothetical protein PKK11_08165 [Methanothrix sp.]|nr:hypothetical protein [Methanothrix sp.]